MSISLLAEAAPSRRRGLSGRDQARISRSPPSERVADGADPLAAQLASRKEFGNLALTADAARRVWTPWWIDAIHDWASDVRYAVRVLAKSPVFALTVIGVLTLGIGANAAIFTLLKGLALTPLAGIGDSSQLGIIVNESEQGRKGAALVSRLQVRARARPRVCRSRCLGPGQGEPRTRPRRASDLRRAGQRQLLSGPRCARRARPDVGAIGRSRAGTPSLRGPQRRSVAPRLQRRSRHHRQDDRDQQLPSDDRRRRRSVVPRHHRRLRRRSVRATDDGAAAWHQSRRTAERAPSDLLADRGAGIFDVFGYRLPGTTPGNAGAQIAALSAALAEESSFDRHRSI